VAVFERLLTADWSTLLNNITDVRISVDWTISGSDLAGMDNIGIVPEPATVALVVFGLMNAFRRLRHGCIGNASEAKAR
jgi:hypothetical protein